MTHTPHSGVRSRSLGARLLAVFGLLGLLATFLPGLVANAHEGHGVVRSEPADTSIVYEAPARVLVEFEGAVRADTADLQVIDDRGINVSTGQVAVDGRVVTVAVDPQVADGVFRIAYDVAARLDDGSFHDFRGSLRYSLSTTGCEARVRKLDQYTSIAAPTFGSPPTTIATAAVDKTVQGLLYATNGRELHRSIDAGCNWDLVLDLPALQDVGLVGDDAVIVEVLTPREVTGLAVALVLDPIDDTGLVQPRFFRAVGPDQPFTEGGAGLPPIALDPALPLACAHPQPCGVAISDAPGVPAVPGQFPLPSIWVATEGPAGLGAQVHRSDDAGMSFAPAGTILPEVLGGSPLERAVTIVGDAKQAGTVWASTGRAVHVSFNGGNTFTEAYRMPGGDGRVITHLTSGTGRDAQGRPQRDLLAVVSADRADAPVELVMRLLPTGTGLERGKDIDTTPLDGAWVTSVARGPQPDQLLLLVDRDDRRRPGAWEYESATDEMLDLDTFDATPWRSAGSSNPICSRWFAHDRDHLYLVDADDGHAHVHDAGDFCDQPSEATDGNSVSLVKFPEVVVPGEGEPADLRPRNLVVQVEPGQVRDIGYRLGRAAEDVPLDVAFLIDSSGSMRDDVDQVRAAFAQVVQALQDRKVDAWFGLAEFNDFALRYRRLADIQPPEDPFSEALASFKVGSGDREPHLTALHQLATGEGMGAVTQGAAVRPGLEMNWRPDAIRVVMLASDEKVCDDPDGPTFGEAVAALNAKDIHVVGMHIAEEVDAASGNGNSACADNALDGDQLFAQMVELARATEAFAERDVDCDGDTRPDIRAGDPIVCTLPNLGGGAGVSTPVPTAFANALVDLVDAVRDDRPFRLVAKASGGFTARVQAAGLNGRGDSYPGVDVTRPQDLGWVVGLGCSTAAAGSQRTFPVQVLLADALIATTPVTVQCGAPTPPLPAPEPAQQAAIALPPPAPVPPPAPIPANAPAAQAVQSTAAAQSAAQAPSVAAAVAPQVEQQAQQARIRDDDHDEYAFSPVRSRQQDSPVPVLAAGMAMAVAAGAVEARRRARATSPARVRLPRA